jgi:hypothetical protein
MDARKYVGESFIKVKDVLDCDLHMHAKSKEFYDIAVQAYGAEAMGEIGRFVGVPLNKRVH